MQFTETRIPGVLLVTPDVFEDERGLFTRAWMPDEFAARGLDTRIAQGSLALTHLRGTIRGMHYQAAPFEETKIVRVVRGAIFDVAVDMRPASPTYRQWVGFELTADDRRIMYIPAGCAHGYQTLADETEVFYFVSAAYSPPHQRGVRWNDPAFGIEWPLGAPTSIHERDASYPDVEQGEKRTSGASDEARAQRSEPGGVQGPPPIKQR
jgi:dTDP-4-dehydrorhamnose 3,5-epimerase